MHIDVKIQYVIDDDILNVHSGQKDTVSIDADYVAADEDEVVAEVESELAQRFGCTLNISKSRGDGCDFIIENMPEVLDALTEDCSE